MNGEYDVDAALKPLRERDRGCGWEEACVWQPAVITRMSRAAPEFDRVGLIFVGAGWGLARFGSIVVLLPGRYLYVADL